MRPPDAAAAALFDAERPRLARLAYRMLGSVADAEDVVQEAWLRWHGTERDGIREPGAFLTRIVSRLCLDVLKSASRRRETYLGPWVPEPLIEPDEDRADEVTLTLMMALERLSPLERAAFLLHDVFGVDFDEVGRSIGREPAACRQLAARARQHVREARPRFPVSRDAGRALAEAFFDASRRGDAEALKGLLAADVVAYSDGGGKRAAALNPLFGQDRIVRFFAGLARKGTFEGVRLARTCRIDGLPGFVSLDRDGEPETTALAVEDGRIVAIYIVRNPDKLGHVGIAPSGKAATRPSS